jgi:hypothetical protein
MSAAIWLNGLAHHRKELIEQQGIRCTLSSADSKFRLREPCCGGRSTGSVRRATGRAVTPEISGKVPERCLIDASQIHGRSLAPCPNPRWRDGNGSEEETDRLASNTSMVGLIEISKGSPVGTGCRLEAHGSGQPLG